MASHGRLEENPDPRVLFDVLDDDACRSVMSTAQRPMTVQQIADEAEIPVSTAYKKIRKTSHASLLVDETEIRPDGHHRSRYVADFDRIIVSIDEHGEFRVDIEHELNEAERQLVGLWSELRKET